MDNLKISDAASVDTLFVRVASIAPFFKLQGVLAYKPPLGNDNLTIAIGAHQLYDCLALCVVWCDHLRQSAALASESEG